MLVDDSCEEIFPAARGLGLSLNVKLNPANKSQKIDRSSFGHIYLERLKRITQMFAPYAVTSACFDFCSEQRYSSHLVDFVLVSADIISFSQHSLFHMESNLTRFIGENLTYDNNESENITLASQSLSGPDAVKKSRRKLNRVMTECPEMPLDELNYCCNHTDCPKNVDFQPLQLMCPFLEYTLNQTEFAFYADKNIIEIFNETLSLAQYRFHVFDGILRICVDDLADIAKEIAALRQQRSPLTKTQRPLLLWIVSLVSQIFSLVGLSLTFLIYILIPRLRTLPGKNTMGLVIHLFLAQLLLLVAIASSGDVVYCQVLGALIHYFWLSSFAWTLVSVVYIYSFLKTFQVPVTCGSRDKKRVFGNAIFCALVPFCVVATCLVYHLIRSKGVDSGYGGRMCLPINIIALCVSFAGPVGSMLIINGVIITRTLLAVRLMSDTQKSVTATNIHHAFVYLKLTLLCGLAWTIGIVNNTVEYTALSYLFVLLTGSQGVLVFVMYFFNRRTLASLKTKLCSGRKRETSSMSHAI